MSQPRTPKVTPGCEKLKAWLASEGLIYRDFGRIMGHTEDTVQSWVLGRCRPTRETMAVLEAVSSGAVPASSWADPLEVEARVGEARDRKAAHSAASSEKLET